MIGTEQVARPQVVKKLWDYIKEQNLQDPANKRSINADVKLLPVFGKPQVTMFELAGIGQAFELRRQAAHPTLNHALLTVLTAGSRKLKFFSAALKQLCTKE